MCNAVKQVMQRVRFRAADGIIKKPRHHVIHVLGELGLAALCDYLHEPTRIGARELARRMGKESTEAKAVRRALKVCFEFGVLRREPPPAGALMASPPWSFWFHPVIVEAAAKSKPWQGAEIVFPRSWDDLSVSESSTHFNPKPVINGDITPRREIGFKAESGSAQENALDIGHALEDGDLRAPAVFRRRGQFEGCFSSARGVGRAGDSLREQEYWKWVSEGFRLNGWSGTVTFMGQRRKNDGLRGGTFLLSRAEISGGDFVATGLENLLRASICAHSEAQRRAKQGGAEIELVYKVDPVPHPLVLIDDLTDEKSVESLMKLPGVALIETSPGCFQASVMVSEHLSAERLVRVQRGFATLYNCDAGAVCRQQLRRPPGSVNQKRGLDEPFTARVLAVSSGIFPRELLDMAELEGEKCKGAEKVPGTDGVAPRRAGKDDSPSAQDFGYVLAQLTSCGLRATNEQIVREVARRAGERRRHGLRPGAPQHYEYASRTLQSALRRLSLDKQRGDAGT